MEIGTEPVPNVVLVFLIGPTLGLSRADIMAPAPRRSGGAAAGPCGGARERGRRIRWLEGVGAADPASVGVEEGGSGGGGVRDVGAGAWGSVRSGGVPQVQDGL